MLIDKDYIKRKVSAQGVIPSFSFILEKDKNLLGKIISEVTHGTYNHVEIVVGHEYWGNKLIHHTIGAQATGVKPNYLKYLWAQDDPIDFDVFTIPGITEEQTTAALFFLEGALFKGYDYKDLVSFLPPIRWLATLPLFDRLLRPNPNKYICSQLAADGCMNAGYLQTDFNSKKCDPVSFAKLAFVKKSTIEI